MTIKQFSFAILYCMCAWLGLPLVYVLVKKTIRKYFWKARLFNVVNDFQFLPFNISIFYVFLFATIACNATLLSYLVLRVIKPIKLWVLISFIIYQLINCVVILLFIELIVILHKFANGKFYMNFMYKIMLYSSLKKIKDNNFVNKIDEFINTITICNLTDLNSIYKKFLELDTFNVYLDVFTYDWLLFQHICKTQQIPLFKINGFFRKIYKKYKKSIHKPADWEI